MKRYFEIIYWLAAVILISLLFVSLTKNYVTALFLAVMMLPGALFAKFFGSSISFKNRARGIRETVYLLFIVLLIQYLAIFLVFLFLSDGFWYENLPDIADILLNPLFIWFLLIAFLVFEKFLAAKFLTDKTPEKFIEFTSERKKIKIEIDTIIYVESCDDIVHIITADGSQYRTRMNITQWNNVLDDRFARVHRAFIVNKSFVKSMSASRLEMFSGVKIEVSKRYRDLVEEWFESKKNER